MSKETTQCLENRHVNLNKQAPYSPDLNMCDRLIFPMLEMRRSKITLSSKHELEDFLNENLLTFTPEIMSHERAKLNNVLLQNVIDVDGDYP